MAITIGNQSSATSTSFALPSATHDNNVLTGNIVLAAYTSRSIQVGLQLTAGGANMTQIGISTNANHITSLWAIEAPGSGNITVTGTNTTDSNRHAMAVMTINGVADISSWSSSVVITNSHTANISAASGNLVIAACGDGMTITNTAAATGFTATTQINSANTLNARVRFSYKNGSSGGTETAGIDQSTTDNVTIVVAIGEQLTPPTVTTQAVSSITADGGTFNGNITDIGVGNCTARGCYVAAGSVTPDSGDTVFSSSGSFGTGAYTQAMTGLSPETLYSAISFATNADGTSTGSVVEFTTDTAVISKVLTDTITITPNIFKGISKIIQNIINVVSLVSSGTVKLLVLLESINIIPKIRILVNEVLPNIWEKVTKTSSTWTSTVKNSSSWSKISKLTNTWTKTPKT